MALPTIFISIILLQFIIHNILIYSFFYNLHNREWIKINILLILMGQTVRNFSSTFTYTSNIWRSFNETSSNFVADSALLVLILYIHEHLFLFTSFFLLFSFFTSGKAFNLTKVCSTILTTIYFFFFCAFDSKLQQQICTAFVAFIRWRERRK